MNSAHVRRRRREAADRYRPQRVSLLLVAEAPPAAPDRYFYFDVVPRQDSLFRYVVQAVLGDSPSRGEKPAQLGALRDRGVFLIDLKLDPKLGDEPMDPYVPDLVERAKVLEPDHVITIKANVCDLCQEPLRAAGLRGAGERIPFPGSGRQRQFEEGMARALSSIGWC